MALEPRDGLTTRALYNAKGLYIELQTSEVYAANADIDTVDTRVDETAGVGDLLPFLTPLTKNVSNEWVMWQNGDDIDGFAGGANGLSNHQSGLVQISATGEKVGLVIKGGTIPADQVPLPPSIDGVAAAPTQNQLDTALRDGMRARSFHIINLSGVS